jgi:UDP-GlcNAc:undecaprenyl-phosphate GlcNAc-1-phosphate transferase
MFNLSAGIKFLLQIFASLFCLYLLGGLFFTLVKIVLLLFLLMAVVNSFNLIDVSDGLLSSVCVPFALLFIFYAFFFKLIFAGYLAQIFLGAILGFMYFNWQPAKIYLGDAGSLFLAATSFFLLTNIFLQSSGLFLFSFIAILIFGVPLAEVFSLVIIRKKLGLPIYLGSPHHFSIYLKRQGLSSQHVAYLSAAASLLLSSLASLVFFKIIPMLVGFFIAATSFVFWLYFIYSPTMPIFRFISFLKRK